MTTDDEELELIAELYGAFDARDVDRVVERLAVDVDWPNAWEGGRLVGRAQVRDYWLRQWEVIAPEVRPRLMRRLPEGRIEVLVDQVIRTPEGDLLSEAVVLHTYRMAGGFVARMDVGDPGI